MKRALFCLLLFFTFWLRGADNRVYAGAFGEPTGGTDGCETVESLLRPNCSVVELPGEAVPCDDDDNWSTVTNYSKSMYQEEVESREQGMDEMRSIFIDHKELVKKVFSAWRSSVSAAKRK
ncbi:hypothetical protein HN446_00560 [bacterium]|mgnify:CR=1 FL=1|nr:hypothetical protein [bacterium]